jgi:hypothetical protein
MLAGEIMLLAVDRDVGGAAALVKGMTGRIGLGAGHDEPPNGVFLDNPEKLRFGRTIPHGNAK